MYFNYFDSERKRKDFRERNVINGIVFIFLEKMKILSSYKM